MLSMPTVCFCCYHFNKPDSQCLICRQHVTQSRPTTINFLHDTFQSCWLCAMLCYLNSLRQLSNLNYSTYAARYSHKYCALQCRTAVEWLYPVTSSEKSMNSFASPLERQPQNFRMITAIFWQHRNQTTHSARRTSHRAPNKRHVRRKNIVHAHRLYKSSRVSCKLFTNLFSFNSLLPYAISSPNVFCQVCFNKSKNICIAVGLILEH